MDNDKETTEPKQIMTEIHNFYSKLYDTPIIWAKTQLLDSLTK